MNFSQIILENRIENFEKKYANKFDSQKLERISRIILPKYLDWVGKNMDTIDFENNFPKLTEALKKFDKISTNLALTDLYSYKSTDQLYKAISEYENKTRRNIKRVTGGNVVYEDDRFFVVNPLTHESSCYYGKGTKWCTASNSDNNFKKYNEDGKLFYVIDKKLPTDDINYKVAILKKFDGGEQYWDSKDIQFSKGWILGTELYKNISQLISDYMEQEFMEQLGIYRDKERQRLEKEKLRKLELDRIRRSQMEEADDRRTEGEWNLGPNCSDEGLKAHALLEWLVDTSDVQARTNEDVIEIERIKNEIERLESEYNNSEDVRRDLLDEISDLEDELSDLESKIDVYNIIPIGGYYDMTEFKVLENYLEDRRYAVGDEYEIEQSCRDYVDNLIDDVGFGGFSQSFAQSYIDESAVRDWAQDFYSDDVYSNPEMYLDESDRKLSKNQEEMILIHQNKIQKLSENIAKFENMKTELEDEEDIEEIDSNISELEEEIQEHEQEIEDINDSPDGNYPDDLISDKVDELVEEQMRDPMDFLRSMDLNFEDFIDRREFIDGVIEADGYGHTLNGYDGNADEVRVQNKLFYVMRID